MVELLEVERRENALIGGAVALGAAFFNNAMNF
jgi:hypothetical protein